MEGYETYINIRLVQFYFILKTPKIKSFISLFEKSDKGYLKTIPIKYLSKFIGKP